MDDDKTPLEYLVKQFSTEQEATKALNIAAQKGWQIEEMTADDRRLWIVFTRPQREGDNAAPPQPTLRRGADLSGKAEQTPAAGDFD